MYDVYVGLNGMCAGAYWKRVGFVGCPQVHAYMGLLLHMYAVEGMQRHLDDRINIVDASKDTLFFAFRHFARVALRTTKFYGATD